MRPAAAKVDQKGAIYEVGGRGVKRGLGVIPGQPAGLSPESISPLLLRHHGFRVCAFGASRNDKSKQLLFI
jgi:hypothetical protein